MDSDWIWEALALGEELLIQSQDIDHFDWVGTHDTYGTPLLAVLLGKWDTPNERYRDGVVAPQSREGRLKLLKFLLDQGANPNGKIPPSITIKRSWVQLPRTEGSKSYTVSLKDCSAYGAALACMDALRDSPWPDAVKWFREAAGLLVTYQARTQCTLEKSEALTGTVAMWRSVLAGDDADVTIACGPDGVEVRAHAVLLRHSSPVLRAMLSPQFREGNTRRLEVDCGEEAVRLLLQLLYVGDIQQVLGTNSATQIQKLAALELAHRWDLLYIVRALEEAVMACLDKECLSKATELAARLGLSELTSACAACAVGKRLIRPASGKSRARLGQPSSPASAEDARTWRCGKRRREQAPST